MAGSVKTAALLLVCTLALSSAQSGKDTDIVVDWRVGDGTWCCDMCDAMVFVVLLLSTKVQTITFITYSVIGQM